MSNKSIAVVGTDTASGKLLLEKLEESNIGIDNLYPVEKLPEEYSSIRFRKKTIMIEKLDDFDFSQAAVVFFMCGKKNISEHIIRAYEAGCYVIDNTGAELDGYETLQVVPEINGEDIELYHARIIRSPQASTIQTALVMNDLIQQFGVESLNITTFESVSGEGRAAVTELANQAISLFNTKPIVNRHFPVQIAVNTVPSLIDFETENSYSEHELAILGELENMMPQISGRICVNSFFVPVFYGHSALISFSLTTPASVDEIRQVLSDSEYISYVDKEVVTPVTHGVSVEVPVVTRLRRSTANENEYNLFSVIDNSLKGEVLNCIQIAEKIFGFLD